MVSTGPYFSSMNYTHMFELPELRGDFPYEKPCKNSILDVIYSNPDFSTFAHLFKLANMKGIYGDLQSNSTLFIPSDKAISHIDKNIFVNMDTLTARTIIKSSTLSRIITKSILQDSPASYFHSIEHPNRLFISNLNGVTSINNDINIIDFNISCSNGIIHVIDNIIWPLVML